MTRRGRHPPVPLEVEPARLGTGPSKVLEAEQEASAVAVRVSLPGGGGSEASSVRAVADAVGRQLGEPLHDVALNRSAQAAGSAERAGDLALTANRQVSLGADAPRPGTDAGDRLLAHELTHVVQQRRDRALGSVVLHQSRRSVAEGDPLVIHAARFADAAVQFGAILDQVGAPQNYAIVVLGASSLQVFDRHGVVRAPPFQLRAPASAESGVHVRVGAGTGLRRLVRRGNDYVPGGLSGGNTNFSTDVEQVHEFEDLLRHNQVAYVVPVAAPAQPTPPSATTLPPDPLVAFTGTKTADLRAWPGAVVPFGGQVFSTGATGSFLMHLENSQGSTTLDRVTNLMQPISFRWEVLKLDPSFRPVPGQSRQATRWDAQVGRYERRAENARADQRALRGEHPERQSIPVAVIREAVATQVASTRLILGMVGESALSVINVVTDRPDNPFSEDIMDVRFRTPGDYFVRCLATPVSAPGAPHRRATTVAGASVSVFNIAELAEDALGSDADEERRARDRVAELDSPAPALPADASPTTRARAVRDAALRPLERTYQSAVIDAHGDQDALMRARLAWLQARLAWLRSGAATTPDDLVRGENTSMIEAGSAEATRLEATVQLSTGALPAGATRTASMIALFVDEQTSARAPMTFTIWETTRVVADELEVVITEVTNGVRGRTFNGTGDGFQGTGRQNAWRAAMRNLRSNLHRGRGWLSYRVPPVYRNLDLDLPNPMQLEMSAADMAIETIDDAAHVATVAALLAAPMTGGASLEILAVLAPVQAATSLYRIVNRSAYGDFHLDAESVLDFINVASLGLSRVGPAGAFATRGQQIVAGTAGVAVRLMTAGNFVVIGWQTFRALTAEDPPGADPREGRRRRLQALLSALEAVSIPVSEHAWPAGTRPSLANTPGQPPHVVPPGQHEPVPQVPLDQGRQGEGPTTEETPPELSAVGTNRAGDRASPTLAERLRGALPEDLQRLRLDVDPSPDFPATSIHLEYTVVDGLITDIRLRVGRQARVSDLQAHVPTIRTMQTYQGLAGRVRVTLERVSSWLAGNPRAGPGTRAWEAKLELAKLRPMILARAAEFANPGTTPRRRAELRLEITDLTRQIDQHAAFVAGMGLDPGRGFVAAEGLSAGREEAQRLKFPDLPNPDLPDYIWRLGEHGLQVVNRGDGPKLVWDEAGRIFVPDKGNTPEPVFAAATTPAEAYAALGGHDPASGFGRFTAMLVAEGFASHTDLVARLQPPGSMRYRTVRGNLKDLYARLLIDHLLSPDRLTATPLFQFLIRQGVPASRAAQAASHAEMLRLTAGLHSSDRGAVAEVWYDRFHNPTGPLVRQVTITPEMATAAGATTSTTRRIDRVEGSALHELKNVSTPLGADDWAAIGDQLALVGHQVPVGGAPRALDRVVVSFLDPAGVLANAREMYLRLDPSQPGASTLTFELFSARGDSLRVTSGNRALLNNPAELRAFARFGHLRP